MATSYTQVLDYTAPSEDGGVCVRVALEFCVAGTRRYCEVDICASA